MTFLKDVMTFWIETWHQNKLLFWAEAFGSATGIIAAIVLNFSVLAPNMLVILTLYLVSAGALAWAMYMRKASFMLLMMLVYFCAALKGLSILLF